MFRKYNQLPNNERPKKNQNKIDLWMVAFSKLVRCSLTPVFEFWGLPLSDDAKDSVADLRPYFPDDVITQKYGSEQAAAVLEKYPNAVRFPDALPSIEVTVEEVSINRCGIDSHDLDEPDESTDDDSGCDESQTSKDEL